MREPTNNDLANLSAKQLQVLLSEGVELLGFDCADRPVVQAKIGIPNEIRKWAVKKDGDPTDVKED